MDRIQSIPETTQRALEVLIQKKGSLLEKFRFYLAGGTTLSIRHSHRISYDLDLFTGMELNTESFNNDLQKDLKLSNLRIEKGTIKFILEETEVSFFEYRYQNINEGENFHGLQLASDQDIGLMKITAIADRSYKRDFYDLYTIMNENKDVDWVKIFRLKFPDSNAYHYFKSLSYFDDAENTPDPIILEGKFDWEGVQKFFNERKFGL